MTMLFRLARARKESMSSTLTLCQDHGWVAVKAEACLEVVVENGAAKPVRRALVQAVLFAVGEFCAVAEDMLLPVVCSAGDVRARPQVASCSGSSCTHS